MPWQGMEITGNLSLMDGKYKAGSFTEIQEVNGVQVVVDRSGEALPQLPKTQFNIGATQTFPTSTGELSLHADYSYISRQYFNPVTAAPGASAEVKAAYAEQNALSDTPGRSEEHTSELQSLMRISYAVFCLKQQKTNKT